MENGQPEKEVSEYKYSFYCVAWLDLLGQGEKLERVKSPSVGLIDRAAFVDSVRAPFGGILQFRKEVQHVVDRLNSVRPPPPKQELSETQKKLYSRYSAPQVDVEFAGDSAILKVDFDLNSKTAPILSTYFLMEQVSILCLDKLANGKPIRGGIDVGVGTHFNPPLGFYGQALSRAYRLESKIADYPRIVIGQHLINFLKVAEGIDEVNGLEVEEKRLIKAFCTSIKEYLTTDYDGQIVLNFLRSENDRTSIDQTYIADAIKFIKVEIERFKSQNNHLLRTRYEKLKHFFMDREVWRE